MQPATTKTTATVGAKPRRRKLRIALKLGAALVMAALAALILAKPILCLDSSPLRPAEVIIVLGGSAFDRAPRAAELFKAGLARKIIVTGDGDCDENRLALVAHGVPNAAIEVECRSTTTRENAQFTRPLLESAGVKEAIIVTSWYHSRRALNTFRAFAPQVNFVSAPAYHTDKFRLGYALLQIYKEYVKVGWYWLRWGVPPWEAKQLPPLASGAASSLWIACA